jgi:large subunit ribosomal protein L5
MSRLKEKYKSEVVAALVKKFNYANVMAVPKMSKIIINMGVGEAIRNPKAMDNAVDELTSTFKLRKGMPIGCCVTLRREHMYEFFDRLVNIALPRVRDFKGVSGRSFDGRGNYTLGLKDQLLFPEVDYGKVEQARGMNVTIVTTAETDEEAKELLRLLGMPFSKN